jgi:hypothetical protein
MLLPEYLFSLEFCLFGLNLGKKKEFPEMSFKSLQNKFALAIGFGCEKFIGGRLNGLKDAVNYEYFLTPADGIGNTYSFRVSFVEVAHFEM